MRTIAVIGGDERAARLAACFENAGDLVHTLGLRKDDGMRCDVCKADVVLFPYPFSVKNGNIPNVQGVNLDPAQLMAEVRAGATVIAGDGIQPYVAAVTALGKALGFRQYAEDALFLQANAEISAEGALCYAMQQLGCTVQGARCLVTGYGLFARALALRLKCLGADVTVAARSAMARLQAKEDGMEAIDFSSLKETAGWARVLLNTVPAEVVGREALSAFPKDALLLELASAPYGFDREAAEAMGLATAVLSGIPGRYAPESAAKALHGAVIRLLEGEEP